jgi:hypothetical protein
MAVEARGMKSSKRARTQSISTKAKLIGLVVGGFLLWQVISLSLAAGHGDYEADLSAADYASTSAAAATMAATQRLQDGDPTGARVFAKEALSVEPLSAEAVRSLGFAEQALGHWQQANAILSQSAALGWRDVATQLWLAQAYLQQGDYPHAAERLDAALRVEPDDKTLYGVLDQFITNKDFSLSMAKRLVLRPNWRGRYLRQASGVSVDTLRAKSYILDILARTNAPPSREEVLSVVSGLIQAKQVQQAHEVWHGLMRAGSHTYDSDFEHSGATGMAPFEWTLLPVLGANVSTEVVAGKSILRASTDGSASGILTRQLIVLPQGPHALSYVGSMPPPGGSAFSWSVRCVDTGKMLLNAQSVSLPFYHFDVPDQCGSQYIELRVRVNPAAASRSVEFYRVILT